MDNYIEKQGLSDYIHDNNQNEEWISLSEAEMSQSVSVDSLAENLADEIKNEEKRREKTKVKSPVLTFQLIVCLIFILLLFLAKTFLPQFFFEFKEVYSRELNGNLFFLGDFSDISYENFFSSTNDEV